MRELRESTWFRCRPRAPSSARCGPLPDAASSAAAAAMLRAPRSTRCLIIEHEFSHHGWDTHCVDLRIVSLHSLGCCTISVASAYFTSASSGAPSHGDRMHSSGGRVHVRNARVHAVAQCSACLVLAPAQPALEHVLTHRCLCDRLCTGSGHFSLYFVAYDQAQWCSACVCLRYAYYVVRGRYGTRSIRCCSRREVVAERIAVHARGNIMFSYKSALRRLFDANVECVCEGGSAGARRWTMRGNR